MRRFDKLSNLMLYLSEFRVPDLDIEPRICASQGQATTRLAMCANKPQIVIARPELTESGRDSNTYNSSLNTAIFVVEKALGADSLAERDEEQFHRLLDIASKVMTKIEQDTEDWDCQYLRDLTISAVEVAPETSIFGGWCGYSIEIFFR